MFFFLLSQNKSPYLQCETVQPCLVVDVHRIMLTSLRAFFMPSFKILAAAFPIHCFCLGNQRCTVSRHGIWQPFFCLNAKQYNVMKKEKRHSNGRSVSVEKVQKMLHELALELCSGRKHLQADCQGTTIVIYTNGGSVNISFNKEGGSI